MIEARETLAAAREAENRLRQPLNEAERKAQRLETEARTLAKLFTSATGDLWPPAVDQITVQKGYETALGAALGDDLEASTNPSAPHHWAETGAGEGDPALPDGVRSLADLAQAPAALQRRLRQIGVVSKADGLRLRGVLKPGQRLVSAEGDLWRWDGFTTAAEAPSPAARRLAEKNRLGDLEREAAEAREQAEHLRHEAEAALEAVRKAAAHEMQAIEAARQTRQALDAARTRLAVAERKEAELGQRRSALQEGLARLSESEAEALERVQDAQEALQDLAPAPDLESRLLEERTRVAERRAAASEARAALQSLVHEAELRRRRQDALAADIRLWTERAEPRRQGLRGSGRAPRAGPGRAPAPAGGPRHLSSCAAAPSWPKSSEAEAKRKEAADRLADAETHLSETDRTARAALEALSAAREARAGSQARHEAAVAAPRRDHPHHRGEPGDHPRPASSSSPA